MNIEGSWFLATINDYFGQAAGNDNDWEWAPLPPLRNGVAPELYELGLGSTLSVNRQAQNADGAAAFVDYLVADKEARRRVDGRRAGGLQRAPALRARGFPV